MICMKTESVSIEMRMPECYSDMHDSEKGLTGGTNTDHAPRGSSAKPLVAGGGFGVAAVGVVTARMGSANNHNGAQIAGIALAATGLTAAFAGLFLVD